MSRAPNILWIVTTQWRAQATGYAGDPNARTSNLDALAAQSVNYAQAVTPHPFGPFARAALLTGIPSPENGVASYYDPLPAEAATIAHTLALRGYTTGYFGKWHLGERDPTAALVGEVHARTFVPPERRGGFSFWEGFESGFLLNDPWLHGTALREPLQFRGYQSDVMVDRFLAWRDARAAGSTVATPWFAVVSLEAPHPPYDAPAAGIQPHAPSQIALASTVPLGGDIETKARRELAGYYAHIEATDRAIGRLIAALPAATIVVFTSVHGDMHGSHGLFRKGWPYEESVRVPFLVRGAPDAPFLPTATLGEPHARESTGVESVVPVSLIDLPAMTVAWSERRPWIHSSAHGHAAISMPSVVALPHQCARAWRGRRSPTRKIIENADGSPWMDFDLIDDPCEQRNRACPL